MELKLNKTVEIHMKLSVKEVEFLKSILQNYMGSDINEEPEDEKEIRHTMFKYLSEIL